MLSVLPPAPIRTFLRLVPVFNLALLLDTLSTMPCPPWPQAHSPSTVNHDDTSILLEEPPSLLSKCWSCKEVLPEKPTW